MPGYARLRKDLVSSPAEVGGVTVYNIKDPITGSYFRLREPEFWLVSQFDGATSCETIAARFRQKYQMDISADGVERFVDVLEKLFFLEDTRSEQATSRKSYGAGEARSAFSRLLYVKVKAFDPTRLLDRLTALYRPFHSWSWVVLQLAVIFLGVGLLSANRSFFSVDLLEFFHLESVIAIVLSLFILVTIHEFAHAVICRYYGGEVRAMGFLLLYFQPCFYTDLSDAWLFKEKSHRLAVTWAGPYFQVFVLALAVIVWRVTVIGTFVSDLARLTAIVCWITLLFNLNPLIKLDGYYLLSDWTDIPNLRRKAFAYIGNVFQRVVLGWPEAPVTATPRERRIYAIYALFALAYSVFLVGFVLAVVGRFLTAKLGGAGLVLLVAVVLYMLRTSIATFAKGIVKHVVYMGQLTKKPLRLTIYVLLATALILTLFVVPFPHRIAGEVTVRPIEEFSLSLNNLGYLESRYRKGGANPDSKVSLIQMSSNNIDVLDLLPLVRDGQRVSAGDTIAILTSSQVTKEIVAGTSEMERLEGQLQLLKALPKKEEIAQAEAEVVASKAAHDQQARELKRVKDLADKHLISTEQVEAAQSAADIAKAELANKRSRLAFLKSPPRPEEEAVLRSAIDKQRANLGFLKAQKDAQQIVSPVNGIAACNRAADRIMTVVNKEQVEVLVPVSDFDINLVRLDQRVKLKVRSFSGTVFEGRVVHLPQGASNQGSGAYFLVSAVVDNQNATLDEGMTGFTKIQIGKTSLARLIARKVASWVRVEFWSWW
jgi:putative peptide zinc metalloprotease protein